MIHSFDLHNGGEWRGDQLADEINKAIGSSYDVFDLSFFAEDLIVNIDIPEEQVEAVQAVVSSHAADLEYFTADLEKKQSRDARKSLKGSMVGLHGLSPRDKAYALLGRAFAIVDGQDSDTIRAIDDKAGAAAYITSKPEWNALPQVAKNWERDMLEAFALILQGMIVAIRYEDDDQS